MADAAGHKDAAGKAFGQPEIPLAEGRADQGQVVRRRADRTAHVVLDPDLAQHRYQLERRRPVILDRIVVLRHQVGTEPVRHAVVGEEFQFLGTLIGPEHQTVSLFAHVTIDRLVTQHRHFGKALSLALLDGGHGFGDPVLVQNGNGRQCLSDHLGGLLDVVARSGHDVLADDITRLGLDLPLAARQLLEAGHLGVAIDLGAHVPGTLGECLGNVGRRNVAVVGIVDAAEQVRARRHQGPELLNLLRSQDLGVNTLGLGDAGIAQVLVHAVAAVGDPQLAALVEADRLACLGLQSFIDFDGLGDDPAEAVAEAVERQKTRGMPGRARRQFGPLQQDDVGPAAFCQAIENIGADAPATNHDHTRRTVHRYLQTSQAPAPRTRVPTGKRSGPRRVGRSVTAGRVLSSIPGLHRHACMHVKLIVLWPPTVSRNRSPTGRAEVHAKTDGALRDLVKFSLFG